MNDLNGVRCASELDLVALFCPAIALLARPAKGLAASGLPGALIARRWWAPMPRRVHPVDHDCAMRYTCAQLRAIWLGTNHEFRTRHPCRFAPARRILATRADTPHRWLLAVEGLQDTWRHAPDHDLHAWRAAHNHGATCCLLPSAPGGSWAAESPSHVRQPRLLQTEAPSLRVAGPPVGGGQEPPGIIARADRAARYATSSEGSAPAVTPWRGSRRVGPDAVKAGELDRKRRASQ